jgi:hypothetical protein
MYKIFEQFPKRDIGCSYEERVEHERRKRWFMFKWRMEKVYALRGESRDRPKKDEVEIICEIYKSCCSYTCCIGHERQYSNSTPIQNYANFEIIYNIFTGHGIEEGLIRAFEQMPECIDLYRDVIKYYKLKRDMKPRPKEHDKINKIYELIGSNKTTEPTVIWVHRGIIRVYKEMPKHVYLISMAIIKLRRELGKKSLLLSRLHLRSMWHFVDTHGHLLK